MESWMSIYTPKQAAKLLHMSEDRVRELCASGELRASNVGKGKLRARWLITGDAIEQFLYDRVVSVDRKQPARKRRQPKPAERFV